MTEFDPSWSAVVAPERATRFFEWEAPPFDPAATGFRPANAWWLVELSWVVYLRRGGGEDGAADSKEQGDGHHADRASVLAAAGLRESRFFSERGTQCAVVVPAAADAEPFAVLVFRGSSSLLDWYTNLDAAPTEWPAGGSVCRGFKNALEVVWDDVATHLATLSGPHFYAGHSLGAALATLAASRRPPRALYTFGSPRVGDQEFAATLSGVPAFRVVNGCDMVTDLPPASVGPFEFAHAGEPHPVGDPEGGPSRRWFDPPRCWSDHAPVNYAAWLERGVTPATGG